MDANGHEEAGPTGETPERKPGMSLATGIAIGIGLAGTGAWSWKDRE